jgi:hypothetical protein
MIRSQQNNASIFYFSDSFNYTFHSMGSIAGICILNYIWIPHIEKHLIFFMYQTSLCGIIFISYQYYKNFTSNHVIYQKLK